METERAPIPRRRKVFQRDLGNRTIKATLRYDDECKNGHNTFSITGEVYGPDGDKHDKRLGPGKYLESCGCVHDQIEKAFPELAHLIKWHLVSDDGPLHYIANTIYHAGNRDCHGLQKGEKRQIRNGRTGQLAWIRKGPGTEYYDGETPPSDPVVVEWEPWYRIGEGKERELDKARSSACWPEATDEELTAPGLRERLEARLPALLEAFHRDMEAIEWGKE